MSLTTAEMHVEMESETPPPAKKSRFKLPTKDPDVNKWGWGFIVKVILMALVNALGFYAVFSAYRVEEWGIFAASLALVLVADWIYFSGRTVPLKYIFPGLAFLLIFQIYTIFFTVYVAFTNYGDGHNSTKDAAISALLQQNEVRVEGTSAYPLAVVERGGQLGFAVYDGAQVLVGTEDSPLEADPAAQVTNDRVSDVPGWKILTSSEIRAKQAEVSALRVPLTEDPNDGSIRTTDALNGYIYRSTLEWDEAADTMTNTQTGAVYTPNDRGLFEDAEGNTLNVGWRVGVGTENFTKAFSSGSGYGGPFWKILLWTIAQAFLSVALTFILGLLLAITFDRKFRGQKFYRTLMILPYAVPGFISALIFAGMFNKSYGFINQILLGGASIPWLTDPWLAKFAVLFVNLWLGFPYMFLICTGALQSISSDMTEAAKIDGAGPVRTWWSIKLPLVLISTAPLLISSFAFNFNNFTLIYMLTGGGPSFGDIRVPLGETDILITMVYKISGIEGGAVKDYGLASALSILIFVIVGTISAISFRQTRKLEEMV